MTAYFEALWDSIDFVARLRKCSCSRLAVNGGLDPTAFNKSKRRTQYGQPHWLSFGTLMGALNGTKMSLVEFAVIYHILFIYPQFAQTDKAQEVIDAVNALLQHYVDEIPKCAAPCPARQ